MGQSFSPLTVLALAFLRGVSSSLWPAIARGESQESINVNPQDQVHSAEQFLDALFGNHVDLALSYLHPQLQREFSPKKLKQRQANFLRRVGVYKERLGSQINDNIVSIKVAFSNVTDTLIVMMDSNGKITGIDFPAAPDDLSAQPLLSPSRP
ncbi:MULTISPECIES: hypothetical protein [unclassified Thermosynechococcus]|uniref:hypothetical protein n=1 Tax=unclassified Thermosynechococcus TaxID=2622553 RepID=UPI0028589C8F|nr:MULTISPECIES: hypothetical protein [unclassified Thermosynechococcus]MDR7922475.1 hypothetical protein [Thermosynechococcus sp. HY213]WNC21360.1 hypothetical protein RHG98_08105 [Thermosynechococcus sp. PP22]WNC31602.1 hypothetical protein RHH81_08075 [Thermosynechococcus sp. PKX95]WNC34126.1 hypothetical protein RHH79_08070 [Thermosynechococcus sp. PKX91]WNC36648.1 hypothetical protein RHI11_08065 [Thermosynechococcus sp. WL11]